MRQHSIHPDSAADKPASVFASLSATGLTPLRRLELGDGMSLALWRRETTGLEIAYAQPGHNTLAYYTRAGHGTRRLDGGNQRGMPAALLDGHICSLPDDHVSRWLVRGELTFMHLYFAPDQIARRAVMELDCEPRVAQLHDRRYADAGMLARLCAALAQEHGQETGRELGQGQAPEQDADSLLRANVLAHETLSALLRAQGRGDGEAKLRGGLAPSVRRRLREYIEANLDQPLTLGMLAAQACLSEYHFLRLFRASFGMPPHAWIAARRIERARTLLRHTALPMQRVADECGYGDLAHFSRRFRQAAGCAPSRYRAAISGARWCDWIP